MTIPTPVVNKLLALTQGELELQYKLGRSQARLAIDLTMVALSVFLALVIRDNLALSVPRLLGILPYMAFCVLSSAIIFSAARLHHTLWRYVSLIDVLRLIAAVTVALLLALLGDFVVNRLEGVARSVPLIQWFLLIAAMTGSRIAVRLLGEWKDRKRSHIGQASTATDHVLVVGVNELTELYLRSVAEFASPNFVVVGLLSPEPELRGRLMRTYKVLGAPKDVQAALVQLEIHGVTVDRIVVTQPFKQLSKETQEAFRELERSSTIKVEWLVESLGLRREGMSNPEVAQPAASAPSATETLILADETRNLSRERYHRWKRVIDLGLVLCAIVALAPLLALTALLVAVDVGFPLVFWQLRPGRYRRPFKLYKFRTMRAPHDAAGNRIPEELRSSTIGWFLRRSRLDELPQLYNILVGEMSFVGPRPLLQIDQPKIDTPRLSVRPGLTGWAQINGGRDISPEKKASLDLWYISHAAFWLDVKILLRTLAMICRPGDANKEQRRRTEREEATTSAAEERDAEFSTGLGLVSADHSRPTP